MTSNKIDDSNVLAIQSYPKYTKQSKDTHLITGHIVSFGVRVGTDVQRVGGASML